MRYIFLAIIAATIGIFTFRYSQSIEVMESPKTSVPTPTPLPTTVTTNQPVELPKTKILRNNYHIFQTFNNCGPAALSMALSYYGVKKSQYELGQALRPYQHPQGFNDDKSVTLSELARKAEEFGFKTYHRPNGSLAFIKSVINQNLPIITRTRLSTKEDIGHYRIIKGYDDNKGVLIQDDSLQGANIEFRYENFLNLWQTFNYEYLILVPQDKIQIVENILGPETDLKVAWQNAAKNAQSQMQNNPADFYAGLNLSVAYYNLDKFDQSIAEFEKVEAKLPFRTLWYQIEPIHSYFKVGNYDKVLQLSEKILNNHNLAFSELYILRGDVFKKQSNLTQARTEYQKAIYYNRNLPEAQSALNSIAN
jgi:tetratricopeptide (TPR) repeat protein